MGIIYKHTNILTDEAYIGRTIFTLEDRLNKHLKSAKNGSDYEFHKALRKYGIDNFQSEILEECMDLDTPKKEEYYIAKYDTYENGYNMNSGGSGYGILSESSKEKFRNTIHAIEGNGKTKAENRYKKRTQTLLCENKDALKIIGQKSSETQKKNGKTKGLNNPKATGKKVKVILKTGEIVLDLFRFEIASLDEKYPRRMILESLKKAKPMYTGNKPRNKDFNEFIGAIACYEDALYSSIDFKFKDI